MAKKSKKPVRLPGRRRNAPPTTLPQGDTGPDTLAQMHRAEIIPMDAKGGDWRFKRHSHLLQWMAVGKGPDGKRKPIEITPRQKDAGMELVKRWEKTNESAPPAWNRAYVQSSPKPGDMDVKRLERVAEYRRLRSAIPRHCLYVVLWCCIEEREISDLTPDEEARENYLAQLREGLDSMADLLGW